MPPQKTKNMAMKIKILLLLAVAFCINASAQPQKNWEYYTPDTQNLALSPVFLVRVNVHFFRNSDGSGNFDQETGTKYALRLINDLNAVLTNNQKMNLPAGNQTPVLPPLYQFVLWGEAQNPEDNGIYFNDDNKTNFFSVASMDNQGSYLQYQKYGKSKGSAINIFLMESTDTTTTKPRGIGFSEWVKVSDAYRNYKMGRDTWFLAGLTNHEIGHSLGLAHTWQGHDGCDDTPINPNCWNIEPNTKCANISNNMMDYNVYQNALSPCQIGTVRRNLTVLDQHQFLLPNWCEYQPDTAIYISQNTVFEGIKYLNCDIIVRQNATLTVKNTLYLPQGGQIILRKNAKIIITDYGLITNDCNQKWRGIKVNNKKQYSKAVIFVGNGKLENTQ